jgi:O-antigen/teichoic acid export membrane protein
MLKKLLENNIVKNFMVLLSGAVIAQALPALFSPIISRIYSPIDFANFAYWSSIANTVAVISTLRYELAIVLPKNNEDAKQILKGSIFLIKSPVLRSSIINSVDDESTKAEITKSCTAQFS